MGCKGLPNQLAFLENKYGKKYGHNFKYDSRNNSSEWMITNTRSTNTSLLNFEYPITNHHYLLTKFI